MTQHRLFAAAFTAIALIIVLAFVFWPTHPSGDSDHARDCWTHPDRHGHRHCYSGVDNP